ncbi:hypothetical protein HYFRA_00006047, partial [Hymenoscyphus fraxineus]
PSYPSPKHLNSNPIIAKASSTLHQILDQTIKTGNSSAGPFESTNTSFALEIWTAGDFNPLFSRYYSAPSLNQAKQGVKVVNADTVFRVGSVTKLLTVYTWLIKAGGMSLFNEPITKYIPELKAAAAAKNATYNPIDYVSWEDITIGDLAAQTANIGREYSAYGDLAGALVMDGKMKATAMNLPVLGKGEVPICGGGGACTRAQFFEGFVNRHPIYAPSTAASYSNVEYMIFAYALENITGIPIQTLVESAIFSPLNLTGSSWSLPKDNSSSIIYPGTYDLSFGDETAAGGAYMTPRNLSSLGRSILRHQLISPSLTRHWMKPRAFTSDPTSHLGAPWEIRRLEIGPSKRLVDIYTKSGDLPGYSSLLLLIPDWDLGITLMAAGPTGTPDIAVLSGLIAEHFLPAVEVAARNEAQENLAGSYSTGNSTLVLTTDPFLPGLGVDTWIHNHTDILALPKKITIFGPQVRLYPTGLKREMGDETTLLGFRAVFTDPTAEAVGGLLGVECFSWAQVDGRGWGLVGSDEFLVRVGMDGKAVGVMPRVMREELRRVVVVKAVEGGGDV